MRKLLAVFMLGLALVLPAGLLLGSVGSASAEGDGGDEACSGIACITKGFELVIGALRAEIESLQRQLRATETERDTAQAELRRVSAALVDEIGRADEAEYRIAELEELLAAERAARKTAESKLSARTKALEFTQSRLRRKSQQFINEKQAHKDTQALLRRVSAALVDEIGRADNTQTNLQSMQQTAQRFAGLWIKTRRELQASQDKLQASQDKLQAAFWDEATVKKAISLALYEDAGEKAPIACLQSSTKVKSLDQAKDGRMKVSFDAGKAVPCGRRQGTKPYTVEQRKRLTEGWITDHPRWLEHRYSEG